MPGLSLRAGAGPAAPDAPRLANASRPPPSRSRSPCAGLGPTFPFTSTCPVRLGVPQLECGLVLTQDAIVTRFPSKVTFRGPKGWAFDRWPNTPLAETARRAGVGRLGGPWPGVLQAAQAPADTGCECRLNLLWLVQGGSRGKNQGSRRPDQVVAVWGQRLQGVCVTLLFLHTWSLRCPSVCLFSLCANASPSGAQGALGLLAWKDLGRESGAESARPGPARASRHGTEPLGPAPRARPEPLGAPCTSSLPVSAGPSAGMRRERVYARTEPRAAGLSFLVWAPLRGLRKAFVSVGDSCQYFPH